MNTRTAIIPAGGTIPADYAKLAGTPHRALAPIGPTGTPVLQIVADALRQSGVIDRLIVAAAPEVQAAIQGVDDWLPAVSSAAANILAGLAACEDANQPALVCASDLPFLTPAHVQTFANQCDAEADITVGLVHAAAYHAAYPTAPPSQFVALRGFGPATLSGLFALRPSALLRNQMRLTQAVSARKSQWRMASLLGPRLLYQWTTGTLALAAVKDRAERLLHCRTHAIEDADPALACDMDTADDYAYARSRIHAAALIA